MDTLTTAQRPRTLRLQYRVESHRVTNTFLQEHLRAHGSAKVVIVDHSTALVVFHSVTLSEKALSLERVTIRSSQWSANFRFLPLVEAPIPPPAPVHQSRELERKMRSLKVTNFPLDIDLFELLKRYGVSKVTSTSDSRIAEVLCSSLEKCKTLETTQIIVSDQTLNFWTMNAIPTFEYSLLITGLPSQMDESSLIDILRPHGVIAVGVRDEERRVVVVTFHQEELSVNFLSTLWIYNTHHVTVWRKNDMPVFPPPHTDLATSSTTLRMSGLSSTCDIEELEEALNFSLAAETVSVERDADDPTFALVTCCDAATADRLFEKPLLWAGNTISLTRVNVCSPVPTRIQMSILNSQHTLTADRIIQRLFSDGVRAARFQLADRRLAVLDVDISGSVGTLLSRKRTCDGEVLKFWRMDQTPTFPAKQQDLRPLPVTIQIPPPAPATACKATLYGLPLSISNSKAQLLAALQRHLNGVLSIAVARYKSSNCAAVTIVFDLPSHCDVNVLRMKMLSFKGQLLQFTEVDGSPITENTSPKHFLKMTDFPLNASAVRLYNELKPLVKGLKFISVELFEPEIAKLHFANQSFLNNALHRQLNISGLPVKFWTPQQIPILPCVQMTDFPDGESAEELFNDLAKHLKGLTSVSIEQHAPKVALLRFAHSSQSEVSVLEKYGLGYPSTYRSLRFWEIGSTPKLIDDLSVLFTNFPNPLTIASELRKYYHQHLTNVSLAPANDTIALATFVNSEAMRHALTTWKTPTILGCTLVICDIHATPAIPSALQRSLQVTEFPLGCELEMVRTKLHLRYRGVDEVKFDPVNPGIAIVTFCTMTQMNQAKGQPTAFDLNSEFELKFWDMAAVPTFPSELDRKVQITEFELDHSLIILLTRFNRIFPKIVDLQYAADNPQILIATFTNCYQKCRAIHLSRDQSYPKLWSMDEIPSCSTDDDRSFQITECISLEDLRRRLSITLGRFSLRVDPNNERIVVATFSSLKTRDEAFSFLLHSHFPIKVWKMTDSPILSSDFERSIKVTNFDEDDSEFSDIKRLFTGIKGVKLDSMDARVAIVTFTYLQNAVHALQKRTNSAIRIWSMSDTPIFHICQLTNFPNEMSQSDLLDELKKRVPGVIRVKFSAENCEIALVRFSSAFDLPTASQGCSPLKGHILQFWAPLKRPALLIQEELALQTVKFHLSLAASSCKFPEKTVVEDAVVSSPRCSGAVRARMVDGPFNSCEREVYVVFENASVTAKFKQDRSEQFQLKIAGRDYNLSVVDTRSWSEWLWDVAHLFIK